MISYESNSSDQQKGDYAVFEVELPNDKEEKRDNLYLFCFDISKLNRNFQFIICVGGVFLFYLLYGYYQVIFSRYKNLKVCSCYLWVSVTRDIQKLDFCIAFVSIIMSLSAATFLAKAKQFRLKWISIVECRILVTLARFLNQSIIFTLSLKVTCTAKQ